MNEFLVAVIIIAIGFLFSELRRRRLAEARLQHTLASVEQQVTDRTAALSNAMAELKTASQLKDDFLATASHELRTPLNAIVGWVHILKSGAAQNDDQRQQAVAAIDRNAKTQTRLIEDLLDVSRMIQGRVSLAVTPQNFRSIMDAAVETVRPAAAAKEIALEVVGADEVVPVLGDERRLQQIAWNLLTNAVKYTPRGGRVTVSSRCEGQRAVFCVEDYGEGIDPEFLPHIFEPFCQGASKHKRSGLGLGLAVVSRLVELHGGRISADSAGKGTGSVFTVSMPLAHGA